MIDFTFFDSDVREIRSGFLVAEERLKLNGRHIPDVRPVYIITLYVRESGRRKAKTYLIPSTSPSRIKPLGTLKFVSGEVCKKGVYVVFLPPLLCV